MRKNINNPCPKDFRSAGKEKKGIKRKNEKMEV